jgi:hypothetical protein
LGKELESKGTNAPIYQTKETKLSSKSGTGGKEAARFAADHSACKAISRAKQLEIRDIDSNETDMAD